VQAGGSAEHYQVCLVSVVRDQAVNTGERCHWPWPCAAAERGFPVVGIDVAGRKVAALNRGEARIGY
jgi:hypothetical protein